MRTFIRFFIVFYCCICILVLSSFSCSGLLIWKSANKFQKCFSSVHNICLLFCLSTHPFLFPFPHFFFISQWCDSKGSAGSEETSIWKGKSCPPSSVPLHVIHPALALLLKARLQWKDTSATPNAASKVQTENDIQRRICYPPNKHTHAAVQPHSLHSEQDIHHLLYSLFPLRKHSWHRYKRIFHVWENKKMSFFSFLYEASCLKTHSSENHV